MRLDDAYQQWWQIMWVAFILKRHLILISSFPLQIFQEVAYKALDKSDFLAGFDGFLDEVTVLPPTEWDPKIKIEPPNSVRDPEARRQSVKTGNLKKLLLNIDEEDEVGHLDSGLHRTKK